MVRLRAHVAAVLGIGLLGVLLPAAPAAAVAPPDPAIGTLSVQEGSVSADVTTPAPAVRLRIWLTSNPEANQVFSSTPHRTIPLASEVTPVTMETWGWTGEVYIWAQTCTTTASVPSVGDCSARVRSTGAFTPIDSTPTITFSDDATVGTGNLPTITVTDNTGPLEAEWRTGSGSVQRLVLNREGTTTLDLQQGVGEVTVRRCGPQRCRSFDPAFTQTYDVQRFLSADAHKIPDVTLANPESTARIQLDRSGTAYVKWSLLDVNSRITLVTGTTEPVTVGEDGLIDVLLVGSEIPQHWYEFSAWVYLENEYGSFTAKADHPDPDRRTFTVDLVAPTVTSISSTAGVIHPLTVAPSGYATPGYVARTKVTANGADTSVAFLHIVSPAGAVVRRIRSGVGDDAIWDGKNAQGAVVPPGQYRVYASDYVGNKNLDVSTVITVTGLRRTNKSWTRTVTPVKSLYDRYVGKCSKLRRPALRGWAGSFGYYANTRCKDVSPRASTVTTMHRVSLPAATGYYRLQVAAYGGAARRSPRSQSSLYYLTTKDRLTKRATLESALGAQPGRSVKDPWNYLWQGRRFYWVVAASDRQLYEVKNFTVTVAYYVIS